MIRVQRSALMLAFALTLPSCGKTERQEGSMGIGGDAAIGGAPSGGSTTGTAGASSVAGSASLEEPCAATPASAPPSPLTRLRHDQLNRTLRALLPEPAAATLPWLPESLPGGDLEVPWLAKEVHSLAHAFALRLTGDTSSDGWLAGCDVEELGEVECREQLTKALLERAYRRPATQEDLDDMAQVFTEGRRLGGDFQSGMRAIVEVALQSPESLYLVELGTGQEQDGSTELTGYETAARLAYFLTRSPPDGELMNLAAAGPIPAEAMEGQARRLLSGSDARVALSHYYTHVLGLELPPEWLTADLTLEVLDSATEASRRFVEEALFANTGPSALLTSPTMWADGTLGSFYGYPVEGTAWQKLTLDPARASGVFTQPIFFLSTSHRAGASAVQRGLRVLTRLLCTEPVPDPPLVIPTWSLPPDDPLTSRQRLEEDTEPASCNECHRDINALGFAFEHFDGLGRWRDTDNGLPVDSSGELQLQSVQGAFSGAPELMQLLASSDGVKQCFVKTWMQAGYGRALGLADTCKASETAEAWAGSDEPLVELLVRIAQHPRFRFRPSSELAP